MTDRIPARAETLNLFDFLKIEKAPSRFVPGCSAQVSMFSCPSCSYRQRTPDHGKSFTCGCGLTMQIEIGLLYVWRSAEVVPIS